MPNEAIRFPADRLLENRIIFMSGDIVTQVADYVITRLLVLDNLDSRAEIRLYIASYGGSVYSGLAIYDAMQMIAAPVSTMAIGPCFSMAAWLLAAGTRGRRFATPNSRIMVHQSSSIASGSSSDVKIAAQNLLATERHLNELMARHTGRTVAEVEVAVERDFWMTLEQAIDFGIIDELAPLHPGKVEAR